MNRPLLVLFALALTSCARLPYRPSGDLYPNPRSTVDEPQVTRGTPNALVDTLGHLVFSLPEKLILWNWKMGSHDISPETEEAIRNYLLHNSLREVHVRLNEYAPREEWWRLVHNESVGAGWRYSIGSLLWLTYTLFPGRLFGGDHYNPYSNTISLYSDLPIVALHEGGHAKDFARTEYKGSVALLRLLPLVALGDEAVASEDAISYAAGVQCDRSLEESGYTHRSAE